MLKNLVLVVLGISIGAGITYLLLQEPMPDKKGERPLESASMFEPPEKEIVYVEKEVEVPIYIKEDKTEIIEDSVLLDTSDFRIDSVGQSLDSFIIDGEDIIIDQEKLLNSGSLVLMNHDKNVVDSSLTIVDSLQSEMNINKAPHKSSVHFELWKSPLGVEGYRFNGSELLVYGMFSEAPIALHKFDDKYYLETTSSAYSVRFTDEITNLIGTTLPKK